MHTPYSDGEWYHAQIAEAAARAGLDVVCVTDHNVWVKGPERYYEAEGRRVLVLVGEEVHDAMRDPQKNHLLMYGAGCELARYAPEPQALLDAARQAGALTFLAHPFDPPAPLFHEPSLSWVNWEAIGFTGMEIWNYMTEFKSLLTSRPNAIRYAFNPELGICGPFPETLAKWDELTAAG
ncbi:MAG: PHP domain-containing protein, partial [Anaerolineales bacterium]